MPAYGVQSFIDLESKYLEAYYRTMNLFDFHFEVNTFDKLTETHVF